MCIDSLFVIIQDVFLKSKLVAHKSVKNDDVFDCLQSTFHQLTTAIGIV